MKADMRCPVPHSISFIKGDGNCLFCAFGQWKYGDQSQHSGIRKEMIEYARRGRGRAYLEANMDSQQHAEKWLEKMARPGAYGDSDAFSLLAFLFKSVYETHMAL
ncbi:hypothetical protein PtB15_8B821 [Puccinia triticina]|nr:hypothetical protein PtB15_8B821 [Puccinia triticina]